jgi:hypothetical protein
MRGRQPGSDSSDGGRGAYEASDGGPWKADISGTAWTIPARTIGNSDDLVRTDEVWFSTTPGLSGFNVRQVYDDPQSGRMTRELVKFTQGEPDAALFQAPADFEVVTQETHEEFRCP